MRDRLPHLIDGVAERAPEGDGGAIPFEDDLAPFLLHPDGLPSLGRTVVQDKAAVAEDTRTSQLEPQVRLDPLEESSARAEGYRLHDDLVLVHQACVC